MVRATDYIWTKDRVAFLKELWSEGLSASQIAQKIGVTKNSVIGKINRLRANKLQPTKPARRKPIREKATIMDQRWPKYD